MILVGDPSNKTLSEKIALKINSEVIYPEITVFPDSEQRVRIPKEIVGEKAYLLKSITAPVDSAVMQLTFLVDALNKNGADKVIGIIPYIPYMRADHVFRTGEAVPLEVVISMIQDSKLNEIIMVDPHSIKIPELFKIPVHDLSALSLFAQKIKELVRAQALSHISGDAQLPQVEKSKSYSNSSLSEHKHIKFNSNSKSNPKLALNSLENGQSSHSDFTIVSPDMGGIRRLKILDELLGGGVNQVIINKDRNYETGAVEVAEYEGEVKGKCFIVDDIISTGKTIAQAVETLLKNGADGVYVFATHPVFSEEASRLLSESKAERIFVTDSIPIPEEKKFEKLEIISIADLLASEIKDSQKTI